MEPVSPALTGIFFTAEPIEKPCLHIFISVHQLQVAPQYRLPDAVSPPVVPACALGAEAGWAVTWQPLERRPSHM